MNVTEVLDELQSYKNESTRQIFLNHGATEPFWGVKIADLKTILKKIKNDQELALELYDSGVSDAKYLAGLLANGAKMSKAQIQNWVENSGWYMISEYTVPWVATENPFALELALDWIDSDNELIASSGWCTLSGIVSTRPDDDLDIELYKKLLKRVETTIHQSANRVKYSMNGFVIALGAGFSALTKDAMDVAVKIGKVSVNMGNTACKVPSAPEYIQKIMEMGRIGKKKKTMKC